MIGGQRVAHPTRFAKPKIKQEMVNSPLFPRRRESWLSLCNELFLRKFLNIKQDSRLRGNDGTSCVSGCCWGFCKGFRLPKRGGDIGSLKMRPRASTACLQAVRLG